ncbi:MAG: homocysteine S-methyltransferase family protein [Acidobacteriota bacterium]
MKFTDVMKSRVLLGDGAMGTQLQALGLQPGESGALWNLTEPEKVLQVQKAYVDAGADLLISNSFTGSRLSLAAAGLESRVDEINRAAVNIAREAFGGSPGFVLGDLGPFGGMMEPYGSVTREEVFESYLEQAEVLLSAGVDALIIETQTSLEEVGTALDAVKKAGAPCVIASMSFDSVKDGSDFRTMMGVSPEEAVQLIVEKGADVIGTNCGKGIDIGNAARIVRRYRKACDLPIMAQPNAGQPEMEEGRMIYRETPEQMAAGVDLLINAGASAVGSCCGTTPEHTALFRRNLDRGK